jgi:hypothetical protein
MVTSGRYFNLTHIYNPRFLRSNLSQKKTGKKLDRNIERACYFFGAVTRIIKAVLVVIIPVPGSHRNDAEGSCP